MVVYIYGVPIDFYSIMTCKNPPASGGNCGYLICKVGMHKYLAVFSRQVYFLKALCIFSCFPVPEASKEVGDVFKCIGDVFCIEFAYGNG